MLLKCCTQYASKFRKLSSGHRTGKRSVFIPIPKKSESHSVMSDSLRPHGLYSLWNSLGQNTGVGSLSLLQRVFPTQGLNPGIPPFRWILYQLNHKGSPRMLEWVAYPFSSRSSGPRNRTGVLPTELSGKPIPKKGNAKECSNYHTIALISHASKVMLKILQARLQQYVNSELPGVQAGFRKGRGTRDQIANIHWIIEKQESSSKTSTSALLTTPKHLTVWITTDCRKFFKRWECQTTLLAS